LSLCLRFGSWVGFENKEDDFGTPVCRVLEKLGNVSFTRLELGVALLRVRVEAGLRLGKVAYKLVFKD
jgi:hypothetical protein